MSKTQLPPGCRFTLEALDAGRFKVVMTSDEKRYRKYLWIANKDKIEDAKQSLIAGFKIRHGDA